MKRTFVLIWIFLSSCTAASAQEYEFSGKVINARGDGVPRASVILSFRFREQLQSLFTLSDSAGKFSILIPVAADRMELSISALGFTGYKASVTHQQSGELRVKLSRTDKLLPEVRVKAAPKVVVKNDTTSFNADAYSRKNETNVEDLLKKLPGFDVDNDGNMRYNGKPIERVLLDGDDLYGRDFKLLTKNLSADAVETVQTIDNYTPNALLNGLGKSGKQVLNLKLRKRKTTFNGNLTIGGGVPNGRYENRLNLLSFSKTIKLVGLGGMNNTGVSPFSFITVERPAYLQRGNDDEIEAQNTAPLATIPELNYRGIAPRRSNLNRSAIGTLNYLFHLSAKTRIKGQVYLIGDNTYQLQQNDITYLTSLPAVKVREETQLRKQQFFQGYRLEATTDMSRKSQLIYQMRFDEGNKRNSVALAFSGIALSPKLKTISGNQEYRLQYINRLNKNIAIDAQLIHNRTHAPQRLLLDSIPYPDALGLSPMPEAVLVQRSDVPLYQTGVSIRLPGKRGMDNFLLSVMANNITRRFDNNVYAQKTSGETIMAMNGFGGYYSTREQNVTAEAGYTKKLSDWDISGRLSWNYVQLRFNEEKSFPIPPDQSFVYPAYRLSVNRKINALSKLNIDYSFRNRLPQFMDIIPRSWLASYRNTDKGNLVYQRLPERGININYSFIDYYKKQLLLYIGLSYRNNPANYITAVVPSTLLETTSRTASSINNNGYLIYNRAEKYIGAFRGNILLDLNSYWGRYQNIISGVASRSTFNITTAKLGFKSVWKGIFNLTLNSALKLNRQRTIQDIKIRVDETRFWETQLNAFFIIPGERASLEITANHYSIPNNARQYQLIFIDFMAQYIVKKDKLTLSLTGNNTSNNRDLSFDNISAISVSTQKFRLVPGFVLLKMYYKF